MCLGKVISNKEYKKASEFIDYDINFSHDKVFATIHVMVADTLYDLRIQIFYIEHLSSQVYLSPLMTQFVKTL